VVPSEPVQTKDDSKPVVIAQVKSNAPTETHIKKPVLALPANARPDAVVAKDPAQKASFLEALGGLSVAHLYQTHLNIGLLADGVESETYTVEEAEKNLKSVIDLMKMVDGQLANVSKSGIDAEDQESIRDLQAIAALLHLQTTALRAYWADGDMEQAANYHKARKGAWQGLSKVMGIEP
jgi:hypothetical protein